MPTAKPIPSSTNPTSRTHLALTLLLAVLAAPAHAQGAQNAQLAPGTRPATQPASLRIGPDGGYMKNNGSGLVIVFRARDSLATPQPPGAATTRTTGPR